MSGEKLSYNGVEFSVSGGAVPVITVAEGKKISDLLGVTLSIPPELALMIEAALLQDGADEVVMGIVGSHSKLNGRTLGLFTKKRGTELAW